MENVELLVIPAAAAFVAATVFLLIRKRKKCIEFRRTGAAVSETLPVPAAYAGAAVCLRLFFSEGGF